MNPVMEIRISSGKNDQFQADKIGLLETRIATQYKQEMNDEDHIELLEFMLQHKGSISLSCYRNNLYDSNLKDWRKEEIPSFDEYGLKRKEVLWINLVVTQTGYYEESLY